MKKRGNKKTGLIVILSIIFLLELTFIFFFPEGNNEEELYSVKPFSANEHEGEYPASLETCNNIDDDNDGFIDEGLVKSCGISNVGECEYGKSFCSKGLWGGCVENIDPTKDNCDGKDNDCDGTIDEGCPCNKEDSKLCGGNIGECEYGTQTCSGGVWGACLGMTLPKTEICDGLDNDCDGTIDEGCTY